MAETEDNPFKDLVVVTPPPAAAPEPLALFRQLAEAIQASIGAGGTAELVAGFATNLGQQYRLVTEIRRLGYRDTLFEAYIKPQGFEVTVNFFGPQSAFRSVTSAADLIATINAEFAEGGPLHGRVQQLAELAAAQA